MCAHALGDIPIPSQGYGCVHPLGSRDMKYNLVRIMYDMKTEE